MYCRKCGNQLDDDSKFCDRCGTRVELIEDDNIGNKENTHMKEKSEEKKTLKEMSEGKKIEEILDEEEPFVVKDIKKSHDKKTQVWNVVILTVLAIVLVVEILVYIPINNKKKLSTAYHICIQNRIEEKSLFDELWADIQEDTDKKAIFVEAVRVRGEQIYLNTEEDIANRLQQLQDLQTWGVVDTTYFQEQLQAEVFCNYLVNGSLDVAVSSLTGISESLLNRYKTCSFQKGEELYQQYLQETITYEAFLSYIQNLQACNILNYPIVDWSARLSAVSANRTAFLQAQEQYNQKNYYEAFVLLNGLSLHQDDTVYNEKIETLKASIVAEAKPHYVEVVNTYLANGDKDSSEDIYKKLKEMYGAEDAEVKAIVSSLVEDWKIAYLEKLRELQGQEIMTQNGNTTYSQFSLLDMTRDGIPELFVFAPNASWGAIKMFTFQDEIKEVELEDMEVSKVYYFQGRALVLLFQGSKSPHIIWEYMYRESSGKFEYEGRSSFNKSGDFIEAYDWASGEGGTGDAEAQKAYESIMQRLDAYDVMKFHDMKEKNYKKYLKLGDLDL